MSGWAGPGTSKNETFPKALAPHEIQKICKQNLFTMLSFWDIAVCSCFREKFKMAAGSSNMVNSEVFVVS